MPKQGHSELNSNTRQRFFFGSALFLIYVERLAWGV